MPRRNENARPIRRDNHQSRYNKLGRELHKQRVGDRITLQTAEVAGSLASKRVTKIHAGNADAVSVWLSGAVELSPPNPELPQSEVVPQIGGVMLQQEVLQAADPGRAA